MQISSSSLNRLRVLDGHVSRHSLILDGKEKDHKVITPSVRMSLKLPSPLVFDCHDNRDVSRFYSWMWPSNVPETLQ